LRHMKAKLGWPIAIVLGVVAPFALPAEGVVEVVAGVVAWIGDMHIAEFAVAANALTIMP